MIHLNKHEVFLDNYFAFSSKNGVYMLIVNTMLDDYIEFYNDKEKAEKSFKEWLSYSKDSSKTASVHLFRLVQEEVVIDL